ncbi:hypothetical protein B0A52_09876 [Exophiala mesophila]|uniref:NADH-ubiquinone oxidoreductase 21.3 kDa subunit n=1 Tax=Exophiala mesophila TaxID=212818 RepID=A0A438MSX9_EXOME|nr:hypothetical protein B0A52_09876 [Exophiala mesophila]
MADILDPKPIDADEAYHPQDALSGSIRAATLGGAAGLFYSAIGNTLTKQNIGAFGVFTRFGGNIGLFAAAGGTYQFIASASANLREKNDFVNHSIGGTVAGALIGASSRKMPSVVLNAFLLGAISSVAGFTGTSVFPSSADDPEVDRIAQKEEMRNRFRRPVNETINELGEGRGIYGQGYEERRRQRLKENYGIDVPEPFYKSTS